MPVCSSCLFPRRRWKREFENGSFPRFAIHPYFATIRVNNLTSDYQPESRARDLLARCFRAIELFENAALLGFRDAWSAVGHADDDAALLRSRRQRYRRACRRVLEGIVDELPQRDFDQLAIHPHGRKDGRDIHLDLPVLYNCSKFV